MNSPSEMARSRVLWFSGLGLWAAALALAAPLDLQLSLAVVDRGDGLGQLVAALGEAPSWALLALALVVLALGNRRRRQLRAWRPLALALVLLALIYPLLVTQAIKFLWGRVRFRDLSPDRSNYTPFYRPAGVGAGLSFPSGHTAMGFLPAPVPFFLGARGRRRAALLAWIVVLAYGLAVAWGRIVLGAHYLTDTLFSMGMELLLAPLVVRRCLGRWG